MKSNKISLLLLLIAFSFQLSAQSNSGNDTLSLQNVLKEVLTNYPSIKKSEQEKIAATARIGLAKSAYFPDISINSNYTHVGPVATISLPGLGSFNLNPADNFSATVNYNQTIYDFGKTSNNIDYENQNKDIVDLSATQLKQRLSNLVINIYYSIVFLQEAINIKNEQLSTLNEHLNFIEKKAASGSATQYEVLTTKVRISAIENQKTDLLTALKIQSCQLNTMLGRSDNSKITVKKELLAMETVNSTDSLLVTAYNTRNEIKIAEQKTILSTIHFKSIGMQNYPVLNFFAASGFKNGYTPDIYSEKLNYAVGLNLKIPLFDANRTKYNKLQTKTEIESNKDDVELIKRNITNDVIECQANISSAAQKIKQSELQLQQAEKAYNLAETSFKSGVITNLELLDNSTSLSEAGLAVLKAKIDYSLSYLKLKIALGSNIY
ncbi:MAG: TolC family protein [Bacteroidetes bacterium]|nr:TolC family protein [Bacteroidota bacterium]